MIPQIIFRNDMADLPPFPLDGVGYLEAMTMFRTEFAAHQRDPFSAACQIQDVFKSLTELFGLHIACKSA